MFFQKSKLLLNNITWEFIFTFNILVFEDKICICSNLPVSKRLTTTFLCLIQGTQSEIPVVTSSYQNIYYKCI